MKWQNYIERNPEIMLGKPVFKGTRLTVENILEKLADGVTRKGLLKSYPRLSEKHIQAALLFAAERCSERQEDVKSAPLADKACGMMPKKDLGRYVIVDPAICHGQPVFRGTRIFVAHILEQVAEGMAWEAISDEWRGRVSKEAIAEAVDLARETLVEYLPDYLAKTRAA